MWGFIMKKSTCFWAWSLEMMKITKPIWSEKLFTFPKWGEARAECCRPLVPEKILSITRKTNEGGGEPFTLAFVTQSKSRHQTVLLKLHAVVGMCV